MSDAGSRMSGAFAAISRALGTMRWAFLPLGLFALLAVGIHAAADTVCERLLWATDRIAEGWDHAMASFELTSPLVGVISFAARTRFARGIALGWELATDLALAIPALGYRERARATTLRSPDLWRGFAKRTLHRPTTLRVLRPIETAAFALAGACAVAKMVQGALYLDLRSLTGEDAAPFAHFAAVLTLAGVGAALGIRAVQRALEHADARSETEARTTATRFSAGLIGSALALPLALAALLDASPVLGFFR